VGLGKKKERFCGKGIRTADEGPFNSVSAPPSHPDAARGKGRKIKFGRPCPAKPNAKVSSVPSSPKKGGLITRHNAGTKQGCGVGESTWKRA